LTGLLVKQNLACLRNISLLLNHENRELSLNVALSFVAPGK